MKGKIILEEAFNLPRLAAEEAKLYASVQGAAALGQALADIEGRIAAMDEAGVEMQVLSLTSPGCQGCADPEEAHKLAVESNNYIAEKVRANPSRFAAFAAVSMHDAKQAAEELTRAVIQLGCVGVMLNDFQSSGPNGDAMLFYDHASYDVFWAAVEKLDVPVYVHPRMPSKTIFEQLYRDRRCLVASAWGFANQLSIHILGIATSGVFDRFPKVQLVFGHMGEHIPFDLWRLDHKLDRDRFPQMRMAKNKTIRDYFATNMHITTSGHFSTRSLQSAIAEISSSRIMFSIDYPYEDGLMEGSSWFDTAPLSQPDLLSIGRENALRLFKLDRAPHNMKPGLTLQELEIGGLKGPIYPDEATHLRTATRG
ncbi:2,3-dihydroxybenzoate decarboxylase [Roridomyces roridus]|uniref:2,3-dihydroxybenzoate decarboxylase n=1 Tax=Roridomyces roridus TaxID=1738132 RepID=A0AAD7FG36_9AGAR|nr:2,3-dihydroxybenzoate decarboxylase [Roridomyces roridus]